MKELLKIKLNTNRIYGLDILRAAAILFVLLHHTKTLIPEEKFKYIEPFIFDGVGVFFVLSGFLIGGILLKIMNDGKFTFTKLKSFWLRRWLRTLPNYFLILTILVILNICFTDNFTFKDHVSYFFFAQNLFYEHPSFFPEAWSLSVEEWFYLLIPVALFVFGLIKKSSHKINILGIIILIIVSVTLYRYHKFLNIEQHSANYGLQFARQVFTRLDSLMYGLIGAYVYFYHSSFWFKFRKQFLILALFILIISSVVDIYISSPFYYCVFSFSITSIITLLFLPFLGSIKKGKGLVYKTLTYISLTSYSIYLINFSIVKFWILPNINLSFLYDINGYLFLIIRLLIYWVITFVIAILLYKYFEIPTTKIRDRFTTNKTNG